LLQELLPNLIEKEKVDNLVTLETHHPQGNEREEDGIQEIEGLQGLNGSQLPNKNSASKIKISSLSMECVRFDQLTLRISEPYWMIHQGNCEHIFTVDEIR
jgi:hypothetical protein